MVEEWSVFWWKNITGAHYIVERVVDSLINNNAAIINVPYDLPWRHDMRAEVEKAYRPNAESDNVIIDQIDDYDDRQKGLSVGRFLLDTKGQRPEIISGYRERSVKTIQEYLISNGVLRNRIIWVKGLSEEASREWISFVDDYHPKSVGDGLFVLEIPGDFKQKMLNNVIVIKYSDYISDNDVQLFNAFMLSGKKDIPEEWKQYISIVTASLCDTDAEASEWLISNTNFFRMEPIEAVARLNTNPVFAMRGSDRTTGHVLALYRDEKETALKDRVWSAQVKSLFPLIEFETHTIIRRYHEDIKTALADGTYEINKKTITDPYDLDIGGLNSLVNKQKKVYIPDGVLRERIDFLRRCRNSIAHHDCCAPDDINKLIMEKWSDKTT